MIAHNLIGGSINGSAELSNSGTVTSGGRISSVTIGGSIISGTDNSAGSLNKNATIRADKDIGSLTVFGRIIGHGDSERGASPVIISAHGQEFPAGGIDLAIGKISIGGRVEFTNILAGYKTDLTAENGDAQIGPVTVGGDWVASNLVAGAKNAPSDNANFGDSGDASIGAGSAGTLAVIQSISIAGRVIGMPASVNASDHFGFVAERIGALKSAGFTAVLTAGTDAPIELSPNTGDMTIREVA